MRWPFKQWGADVVLSGHDHDYERLSVDGLTYFVNGSGGRELRSITEAAPGSQVLFDDDFGAMLVSADDGGMTFQFITRDGDVIDNFSLSADPSPVDPPTSPPALPPAPPGLPDLMADIVEEAMLADVIGGDRGRAMVRVRNVGGARVAQPVQVKVYLSDDATLDTDEDALLATLAPRLRLRPIVGQATLKLGFIYPSDVDGDRFLLTQVDETDAVDEADGSNNVDASAVTVHVARPFVSVQSSVDRPLPQGLRAGARLRHSYPAQRGQPHCHRFVLARLASGGSHRSPRRAFFARANPAPHPTPARRNAPN